MAISVVMPALEMAQETGRLVSWLKKEGDTVAKGELLLEIETDKAVMEIESPGEGILAGIKVQAGVEVPVGQTIAWIVRPGEKPPTEEAVATSGRKSTATADSSLNSIRSAAQPLVPQDIKISPKARRLATEKGVNLTEVRGSGSGGEILSSDILAAAEGKSAAPVSTTSASNQNAGSIARLMAERTTQSWATVPHFFLSRDVDASALNEARKKLGPKIEATHGVKPTHSDLLVLLVSQVLPKHARLNSSWSNGTVQANGQVNIGLAMAVEDGVVAPVIQNANKLSLGEVVIQRRDLAERARSKKLHPTDLVGGTFTISNLGMFGVDAFTAIVIPPQAAILAVGAITDRVIAMNSQPTVRPMMTLTLSTDHRVADGARSAEFMRDLVEAIAHPEQYLKSEGLSE